MIYLTLQEYITNTILLNIKLNIRNIKHSSKVYQISDECFIKIIQESFSQSECLRKLGLQTRGGRSTQLLKRKIKDFSLSLLHRPLKQSLKTICVENSTYTNMTTLKRRLIKEQILKYECTICQIFEWNSKPLSLQLDHINGINNNNRIENLRLICPNCHSQTETYAGQNRKQKKVSKILKSEKRSSN